MPDIFTRKKRTQIMRCIGSKNSKPEREIANLLHELGYNYISHGKNIPGKPDFAFPQKRKIIFVNGCFWHGHTSCKRSVLPATNRLFWKEKITLNKMRDHRLLRILRKNGWSVMVIWQCKIHKKTHEKLKNRISLFLK